MHLPAARGPLTSFLIDHLRRPPHRLPGFLAPMDGALDGDDFQLALYLCYELHYRGFDDVDDAWEWEPSLIELRRRFEDRFERALRAAIGRPHADGDVLLTLRRLAARDGISLAAFMHEHGTLEQFRELVLHRSAYQLKEADPHTWAIPRLDGIAKAALVAIQSEEYGEGDLAKMHSVLFAGVMDALGLDATYGRYLDLLPGTTLATVNLISMFGLHRRLRGALVGHLALFEMTSTGPNSSYAAALRRMGAPAAALAFYDEHVEADAMHEIIACEHMAGSLAADGLGDDVIFGARALDLLEGRFAAMLIERWHAGGTSLRETSAVEMLA
ncbi:MAG TPA: iron-containing redox enzyme family protein [Actinomycetota bacterium]|nr:iron-containing redox enzyme family protein [Actinomycetota bacterium]